MTVALGEQKFLILRKSRWLIFFSFLFCAFCIVFEKFLPNLRSLRFSFMIYSICFMGFSSFVEVYNPFLGWVSKDDRPGRGAREDLLGRRDHPGKAPEGRIP